VYMKDERTIIRVVSASSIGRDLWKPSVRYFGCKTMGG
jgi:hypothetical protein